MTNKVIKKMDAKERERFDKYHTNGIKTNVAIIATKIEAMQEDVRTLQSIVPFVHSTRARSKLNTWIIGFLLVALLGIMAQVLGGVI